MTKLPASIRHVAVIMDGNGRWARSQGYVRTFGHIKGARVAKKIITHAAKIGLPHLTLFAFSTENWLRPKDEVDFLMNLLDRHLRKEKASLIAQNIRFRVIGDLSRLPEQVRKTAEATVLETSHCTGLNLTFAINYGGRQEILAGLKRIAAKVETGELDAESLTEQDISLEINGPNLPDPDLILRTSGEQRLSNFMLWQVAYSEIMVVQKHWPDFTEKDFDLALNELMNRDRRFGGVKPPTDSDKTIQKSNLLHLFQ
jgi:undecaprenyl diphosphate synthase